MDSRVADLPAGLFCRGSGFQISLAREAKQSL
jgi:hypothetical protein